MLTSHSPNHQHIARASVLDHQHIARAAIRNGVPIPAKTTAVLEAHGVDPGELEARILQNMEFRR